MPSKNNKQKLDFKSKVLQVVSLIPKGETYSYKQVATLAGNPQASRVVAQIMSSNYKSEVPCHRVIRSDGTLGGYNRGGEEVKRKKLRLEGVVI